MHGLDPSRFCCLLLSLVTRKAACYAIVNGGYVGSNEQHAVASLNLSAVSRRGFCALQYSSAWNPSYSIVPSRHEEEEKGISATEQAMEIVFVEKPNRRQKTATPTVFPIIVHEKNRTHNITVDSTGSVDKQARDPLDRYHKQARDPLDRYHKQAREKTMEVLTGYWKYVLVAACALWAGISLFWWSSTDYFAERNFFCETSSDDDDFSPHKFANVWSHVNIDHEGGFDKVQELELSAWRCLFATFSLLMAFFNTSIIFQTDLTFMHYAAHYYNGEVEDIPSLFMRLFVKSENNYLVRISHMYLVNLLEVAICFGMLVAIVFRVVMFWISKRGFDKFNHIHICFERIRSIRTFSALRIFKNAHPALVTRHFWLYMGKLDVQGQAYWALHAFYFVVTRVIVCFLGLFTFAVKLCSTSLQFEVPDEAGWLRRINSWCILLACFVQVSETVNLRQLLLWRVEILIAGGMDCRVDRQEKAIVRVYYARLTQVLWEEGSAYRFFVLMLTFDDEDLQRLLLEEDLDKKTLSIEKMKTSSRSDLDTMR